MNNLHDLFKIPDKVRLDVMKNMFKLEALILKLNHHNRAIYEKMLISNGMSEPEAIKEAKSFKAVK